MKPILRALAGEPGDDEPLEIARHRDHRQEDPRVVVRRDAHADRRRWPQHQVGGHRQPDDGGPCPEGRHKDRKFNRMKRSICDRSTPVNAKLFFAELLQNVPGRLGVDLLFDRVTL